MRRGFTLLELVVVVIILGILATLGFTQYTKMVEKGRTAEAKMILGQIRSSEAGYIQQYGAYTSDLANLSVQAPTSCVATHYFSYSSSATTGTGTRCTTAIGTGKAPGVAAVYTLTLTYAAGDFGGTAGYY
jgi:type IV pilus assembly protein PilE